MLSCLELVIAASILLGVCVVGRVESKTIEVHFVSHSHMDAGWLKTFDEYYENEVKRIFNSVFEQLEENPDYTFTLGDIAFFQRFYSEIPSDARANIQRLVRNGQLDLVHGGLVSNDEACPNYSEILRNYELGSTFLREEFGVRPKIAWQLDPFGHSAANADLLAALGFETLVFSRVEPSEFKHRKLERELQFLWKPQFAEFVQSDANSSKSVDERLDDDRSGIFTHILFDHYNPPRSFVDVESLA